MQSYPYADDGRFRVMPPGNAFSKLSVGADHSCAIVVADSSVRCWGSNSWWGQCAVPSSLLGALDIAAGITATCAVVTEGYIKCWVRACVYRMRLCLCGHAHGLCANSEHFPCCWRGGGRGASCLLRKGAASSIRLHNQGSQGAWSMVSGAPTSGGFVSVVISGDVACGLAATGSIWCWGKPMVGAPTTGAFSFVAVGRSNACALGLDGTHVHCWGTDAARSDLGYSENWNKLPDPAAGDSYVAIVMGNGNSCFLSRLGVLGCVGGRTDNSYSSRETAFPRALPTSGVANASCGDGVTCVVSTGGALSCTGQGPAGQADMPAGNFSSVACGDQHCCALRVGGTVTCFGYSNWGGISPGSSSNFTGVWCGGAACVGITTAGAVVAWGRLLGTAPSGVGYVRATVGNRHACAWRGNGTTVCFGTNDNHAALSRPPPPGLFADVACGMMSCCAVLSITGALGCWGAVGSGNYIQWQIMHPGGTGFVRVFGSGSAAHYCALRGDASLVCFGAGESGQASAPGGAAFASVAVGTTHTCAVTMDAALRCWGSDKHMAASAGGVVVATACAAGAYGAAGVCSACPAGSFCLPGVAFPALCPLNTYSAAAGAVVCTACPALRFTAGDGASAASACEACASGSYSNGIRCVRCPAGYAGGGGREGSFTDVCVRCAVGTTNSGGAVPCGSCGDVPCGVGPGYIGDSVAVGSDSSCAVQGAGNGPVTCVGAASHLGTYVAAAGDSYSVITFSASYESVVQFMCALNVSHSALVCWGPRTPTDLPTARFEQICAGADFVCGIGASGALSCGGGSNSKIRASLAGAWWQVACSYQYFCATAAITYALTCVGAYVPVEVPSGAPFAQLSCGAYTCCGVDLSGSVACWGGATPPQLPVASGLAFVQVSVGYNFVVALTSGGRAVAFPWRGAMPETELVLVVASHSAQQAFCGVRPNALLVCVGASNSIYSVPAAFADIVFRPICRAGAQLAYEASSGSSNCDSVCTAGAFSVPRFPCAMCPPGTYGVSPGAAGCVQCAAGTASATPGAASAGDCAPCAPGTFAGGGAAVCVPCGIGKTSGVGATRCIAADDSVGSTVVLALISAREDHVCAVSEAGIPVCWGRNSYGQLAPPSARSGVRVTSVAVGSYTTCVLTIDGTVDCWGYTHPVMIPVPTGNTFSQICAGREIACGLDTGGQMSCWGWSHSGILLEGLFTQITCGDGMVCGLRSSGIAWCGGGVPGSEGNIEPAPAPVTMRLSFITAGLRHVCGLTAADSSVVCWTYLSYDAELEVTPPGRFVALAAGAYHTCGIRAETNELHCWCVRVSRRFVFGAVLCFGRMRSPAFVMRAV